MRRCHLLSIRIPTFSLVYAIGMADAVDGVRIAANVSCRRHPRNLATATTNTSRPASADPHSHRLLVPLWLVRRDVIVASNRSSLAVEPLRSIEASVLLDRSVELLHDLRRVDVQPAGAEGKSVETLSGAVT